MSQQDVWDAEDAEVRRVFAAKDAEILQLSEKLRASGAQLTLLSAEIERLKAQVTEYGSEAEELAWFKKDATKLIIELADALEEIDTDFKETSLAWLGKLPVSEPFLPLIQRAREAIKRE